MVHIMYAVLNVRVRIPVLSVVILILGNRLKWCGVWGLAPRHGKPCLRITLWILFFFKGRATLIRRKELLFQKQKLRNRAARLINFKPINFHYVEIYSSNRQQWSGIIEYGFRAEPAASCVDIVCISHFSWCGGIPIVCSRLPSMHPWLLSGNMLANLT